MDAPMTANLRDAVAASLATLALGAPGAASADTLSDAALAVPTDGGWAGAAVLILTALLRYGPDLVAAVKQLRSTRSADELLPLLMEWADGLFDVELDDDGDSVSVSLVAGDSVLWSRTWTAADAEAALRRAWRWLSKRSAAQLAEEKVAPWTSTVVELHSRLPSDSRTPLAVPVHITDRLRELRRFHRGH